MIIIKVKNITAYILLFLGVTIGIKTLPSAIHRFLNIFNVNNTIDMDLTNCQTIGYSITANHFFYALFLFALLCLCVGILLLFRKHKFSFQKNFFDICFLVGFIFLCLHLLVLFLYIFLLMLEDSLFDKHLIYNIAFIIGCFTNLLFLALYSLIWFDKTLTNEIKLICLLALGLISTEICIKMFSFINLYGIDNVAAGLSFDAFFDAFNYIFKKLGIGAFCMENGNENPCIEHLARMQEKCGISRDVNSIPRVPYGGGSFALRWIARIMNVGVIKYKHDKQEECNEARQKHRNCEDFFKSENYKKNKPK